MVTVGMDDISVAVFLPSWDDSFFKKHTWRVFDMIVKSYKKSLLTKLSEWFLKENLKVENIDVILKNLLILYYFVLKSEFCRENVLLFAYSYLGNNFDFFCIMF